jgi:hypothetical protein
MHKVLHTIDQLISLFENDMNGRSQMQGGKNWILPKGMNAKWFFCDLIGWKSGQTTLVPQWDRMEKAWKWALGAQPKRRLYIRIWSKADFV